MMKKPFVKSYSFLSVIFICTLFFTITADAQNYIWTVAGNGTGGFSGDGGPATSAQLSEEEGVWLDAAHNIYIADMGNQRIRKVNASTGIITTIGGTGIGGFSGDGGPATIAQINTPYGLCVDTLGNCYFADRSNNRIRRIDATTGIITTVAGTGGSGYSGDGGLAISAQIDLPMNVYVDNNTGNLYIAAGGRIRKVAAGTGIITTVAGSSSGGYSGDGGPATNAQIDSWAAGIVTDASGNIFIADRGNHRIRKITASTGIITTVAGTGVGAYSGDGGPATIAEINGPIGLSIDLANNLIISDNQNNRVREVYSSTGIITTIGGGSTSLSEGVLALSAFIHPEFFCLVNGCGGGLYLSNWVEYNQIRMITNVGMTFAPSPIFGDSVICVDDTTTLHPSGASGGTWSSGSLAVATVGSSSGIVTGITTGTTTITYYPPTGCFSVKTVTVNSTPDTATITGPVSLCMGSTLTLSATIPAGAWSSGTPGIATTSATGVVTGITSGSAIISYSLSNACGSSIATKSIIVLTRDTTFHDLDTSLCAAISSITLSGPTGYSSYEWSTGSTAPSITVAASGSYLDYATSGCDVRIDTFNVVYYSTAILGDSIACIGGIIPLHPSGASGGTWSSGSLGVATVGSSSGIVTGISTGSTTITYFPPTGCFSIKTVSVNSAPDTATITGPVSLCMGSTLTLSATIPAGAWSSGTPGIATISATGVVTGIISGSAVISYVITNACGSSIATKSIIVLPSDTTVHHMDTSVCASVSSITISGPTGYSSYAWSTGSTTPSITVAASGNYINYAVSGCNTHIDTFSISVYPLPAVSLGNDTVFCSGNAFVLSSLQPDGSIYIWNTGVTTPSISVTATGVYWLDVTNIYGCSATDTINITVVATPVVNLGPDVTACVGTTVLLQSLDTYISPSYFWSTGSVSASIEPTLTNNYWLRVTISGCIGTDTVNVTFNPIPIVSLGNDTSICAGDSIVLSSPESVGSFLWNTGSQSKYLTVSKQGTFILTVTEEGCISSDTIQVNQYTTPLLNLGPDITLCVGQIVMLSSGTIPALWNNGVIDTGIEVIESGRYWASITNACGTATDSINVNLEHCDIFFPSAFTPNNDGKNDLARAIGSLDFYRDYSLNIYNRFGQLVYSTKDIYSGWDGTFEGVPQDIGTYFYLIFYSIDGNKRMMKGDITLIR